MRMLIMEGDGQIRRLLEQLLAQKGHEVESEADGLRGPATGPSTGPVQKPGISSRSPSMPTPANPENTPCSSPLPEKAPRAKHGSTNSSSQEAITPSSIRMSEENGKLGVINQCIVLIHTLSIID